MLRSAAFLSSDCREFAEKRMSWLNYILCVLLLLPCNALASSVLSASKKIEHRFNVSTEIELTNLFPYSVSLEIANDHLTLNFNKEILQFDEQRVGLTAISTIPHDYSEDGVTATAFTYNLEMLTNTSQCISSSGEDRLTGFMGLLLRDNSTSEEFDLAHNPLVSDIAFNNISSGGYLIGELELILAQNKSFTNEIYETPNCSGEIEIGIELSL